jgi:VanZ family protein
VFRIVSRRAYLWLPPIAYAALIFWLSSLSDPLPQVSILVWDKALHAIEYAGLGFLVCRALRGEGLGWSWTVALAIVVTAMYGGGDEWHQAAVAGRQATASDWTADLVGAILGAFSHRPLVVVLFDSGMSGRRQ